MQIKQAESEFDLMYGTADALCAGSRAGGGGGGGDGEAARAVERDQQGRQRAGVRCLRRPHHLPATSVCCYIYTADNIAALKGVTELFTLQTKSWWKW